MGSLGWDMVTGAEEAFGIGLSLLRSRQVGDSKNGIKSNVTKRLSPT